MAVEASTSGLWKECLQHVKFWRNEVKRSLGEPINRLEIVEDLQGKLKIYALANALDDYGSQQTIVCVDVLKRNESTDAKKSPAEEPITLVLKPFFNNSSNPGASFLGKKPPVELCLFYERLRSQLINGISGYSVYPKSNTFLLTSPSRLHVYKNDRLRQIGSYVDGVVLNASASPVDPNFVAFVCRGQLYIDKHNETVFSTKSPPGKTSGVASFVVQEEFERYEGFWWSPTRVEVLYEKVDETEVDELYFGIPGTCCDPELQMRYPLAGQKNSTSTLMICHINVEHGLILDLAKQVNLKKIVPWYEYLVRCGWTHDGENVWVYVMNREQTQSALLLLPRIVFCNEVVENAEDFVKILYEEKSNTWINYNNLIHFLPNEPDGSIRAIIGSEKRNVCHLYLHIFNISYEEPVKLEEIGEDSVMEEFSSSGVIQRPREMTVTTSEASDALPSLPLVSPKAPVIQYFRSDDVMDLAANPPPLPPSVILPTPMSTDRRPSIMVRRLSQQVGVLTDHRELPITDVDDASEWSVYKETKMFVDYRRQHVYYICGKVSPAIISLAVSSYGIPSRESRLLTPEDLCFKYERCQTNLSVNPDHGFVCWLSNAKTLPECRFYRLVQANPSTPVGLEQLPDLQQSHPVELPSAVFAYRIGVESLGANPLASIMPPPANNGGLIAAETMHEYSPNKNNATGNQLKPQSIGQATLHRAPSSLFHSKLYKYTSANSGKMHYAFLLWPTDIVMDGLGKRAVAAGAKTRAGRFPLIQAVYGGPGTQMVRDSWLSVANYMKYLTLGFAVLLVDGRGSANRGVEFEAPIKNALGSVELEDQVEGLQVVASESAGLLDTSRVVVTGWSYGGYVSTLLLANYPHIYRAACAGGAVVDWRLYDTAYTEKFMGLPHEHEAQYRASSFRGQLSKLPDEDGRLLVVHGLLDENVHFHHTEKLINGLISAGKPHQLLLFPSERHSVRNGDSIEYFHSRLLVFFMNALAA